MKRLHTGLFRASESRPLDREERRPRSFGRWAFVAVKNQRNVRGRVHSLRQHRGRAERSKVDVLGLGTFAEENGWASGVGVEQPLAEGVKLRDETTGRLG